MIVLSDKEILEDLEKRRDRYYAWIGSFVAVDPGFRGQVPLNLHNDGDNAVMIRTGEPIVRLVFHKLGNTATKGYSEVYQDSKGIVKSKKS